VGGQIADHRAEDVFLISLLFMDKGVVLGNMD
jgi:hypothetical protein